DDVDKLRADLTAVQVQLQGILDRLPTRSVATSRDKVPKPKLPALGPAGTAFPDPSFGTKMLRVTDQATRGITSTSWRTSSTSDRIWNADGTMFFLENTGGSI